MADVNTDNVNTNNVNMDEVKEKISAYLSKHPYMRLGTLSQAGTPVVHTVGFVSEGATVYFMTSGKSRKAQNIMRTAAVAYTVDICYTDLGAIQGVQMEGSAARVEGQEEAQKVMALMAEKYPYIKDVPENPDYVIFKVMPSEGFFIDNTVAFGHRDKVVFT